MAVGDCAQAFLQAPILEKSDVWVTPPPEAEVQPGRAWRLLKTLPGLKGGPAAWGHHATKVKEERYGLIQSARDPCVHSNVRERMWTAKVSELTEDMGHTMLLRDVQFLEPGKPPVKFLGWMLERTINGFRLMINPQLIEDIVQDSGLANSTRKCATAGVKDRVVDETPLEREEHSYFRNTSGDVCCFCQCSDLILQYAVGQLARHASAPTVSDRIALKRLIRFLSVTREMKLELFPKGRLVLSAMADADWAGSG